MPNIKYQCEECEAEVHIGEKYCHECGAKLTWPEPEEEIVHERRHEEVAGHHPSRSAKYVNEFIDSSLGKGIASIFLCTFGIIIGSVILFHRSSIKSILKANDGEVTKSSREVILKKLKAIRSDASVMNVLTIIGAVLSFGNIARNTAHLDSSFRSVSASVPELAPIWIIVIILHIIGCIIAVSIKNKATEAIAGLE